MKMRAVPDFATLHPAGMAMLRKILASPKKRLERP
jgi:hypothetical protein